MNSVIKLPRNELWWYGPSFLRHAHDKVKHMRLKSTLNENRSRYWICKGKQTVKSVISKCVICKYVTGKVMLPPKEYLIQLHEHHIYTRCKKHDEVNQLLLNDVVLIRDDSLKRNMWRKGKVNKLVKGWKNPWSLIESVSWRVHNINS